MSPNSDQDSHCEYTDLQAYVMCLHTGFLWKDPQVEDAAAIPYPREENEQAGGWEGVLSLSICTFFNFEHVNVLTTPKK